MNAAALPRDAFAPRPPVGMRRGFGLAFAVHVLLVIALAWSVNWKASDPEGVVAELWSAVPQMAAPRAVAPEPRPVAPQPRPVAPQPPPPVVEPKPTPTPPTPKPEPAVSPREDAQIAIERAAREKERRAEADRAEAARKAERTRRDEARKVEEQKQALQKKRLADEQAEKKKLAEQARLAEAKAEAAAKAKADAKAAAQQAAIREANLRRMKSLAGESDDPGATGTAARTSGPSAGYAGRIKARIKPNIVLTGDVAGNPTAEIEVRVAPDGTIVGRKVTKSSGSAIWDQTVLRAIDKTEILPRDTDGRVPPVFTMTFRPIE